MASARSSVHRTSGCGGVLRTVATSDVKENKNVSSGSNVGLIKQNGPFADHPGIRDHSSTGTHFVTVCSSARTLIALMVFP